MIAWGPKLAFVAAASYYNYATMTGTVGYLPLFSWLKQTCQCWGRQGAKQLRKAVSKTEHLCNVFQLCIVTYTAQFRYKTCWGRQGAHCWRSFRSNRCSVSQKEVISVFCTFGMEFYTPLLEAQKWEITSVRQVFRLYTALHCTRFGRPQMFIPDLLG